MPNATISVDATLKARLADLASQTGQQVDEFVEALLRRIAEADVRFERGVPVGIDLPGQGECEQEEGGGAHGAGSYGDVGATPAPPRQSCRLE